MPSSFRSVSAACTWSTALLLGLAPCTALAEPTQRLSIDHQFELGSVSDPALSPDGEWMSFTVSRSSLDDDRSRSRI